MNYSGFFIPTLREVPADAVIASHRLMFRSGMIRKLANGLFAYLPLGLRAFRKVEQIVREEMDAIGALEMKPTVVQPGEVWKESGRWEAMGDGMLRARNRLDNDFVISPTAEEAFTAIVRDELSSYKQLPLVLYQINTKFRDEIRPRYGVMRGREFVMKDAYSWHCDDESLDKTYQAMGRAYRKIFKRCGLSVIPVKADSGAMGGSGSEEFMVESEIGDNTLILCKKCDYAANVEKAGCKPDFTDPSPATQPYEKIDTPDVKTIEELGTFLKNNDGSPMSSKQFIKTLIYRAVNVEIDLSSAPGCKNLERKNFAGAKGGVEMYPQAFFAVAIRGDLDVNEAKLAALVKAGEVALAADGDVIRLTNAPVGFAGPVGLVSLPVIVDHSVTAMNDAVTGALSKDLHYRHVAYGRDFTPWMTGDLRTVKAGDLCPVCGGTLYEKKGNELGHIFKLGYKYTRSMNVHYLDENGKSQTPTMGSYGIGVDRALASVIEEHHDEAGIIWPVSVAPYHVIIVPIKYDGEVKIAADRLAAELEKAGIEVLLDDRNERPGVKFNDADLTGIPWRVVIGDKGLAQDQVEIKRRGEKESRMTSLDTAAKELAETVNKEK
jgi:prolyl-tRNA synthetase